MNDPNGDWVRRTYGSRTVDALTDLRAHAAMAQRLVSRGRAEFDRDEAIRLAGEAVIHRIGESAGRLPDAFVADFPALRLRAFKGMRNLVAHRYQHVDYEIIWETIAVDVPRLDRSGDGDSPADLSGRTSRDPVAASYWGGSRRRSPAAGNVRRMPTPLTADTIATAPKVLLHDHLDGGLRPATLVDLAEQDGYDGLPTTVVPDLARWFSESAYSGSLERYLETFVHTTAVMQTRESLIRVASECVQDLAADGVVYAEVRFAPELHTERNLTLTRWSGPCSTGSPPAPGPPRWRATRSGRGCC